MKYVLSFILTLAMVVPSAQGQDLGVGLRVGSTGIGANAALGLTKKLNVRLHYAALSGSYTETTSNQDPNLTVDTEVQLGALAAMFDIHPFANSFRLVAGVGRNTTSVNGTGAALDNVCLGDEDAAGNCSGKEFTPEKLGDLTVSVDYPSSFHPYMGIGFGNLARGSSRLTFLFDVGVFYTGSPEIEMENNGLFRPTTTEENVQVLNDGIETFVWYPVFSIGIGFRL